jgi:hypothetical protein
MGGKAGRALHTSEESSVRLEFSALILEESDVAHDVEVDLVIQLPNLHARIQSKIDIQNS